MESGHRVPNVVRCSGRRFTRTPGLTKFGQAHFNPALGAFTQQDTGPRLANPRQRQRLRRWIEQLRVRARQLVAISGAAAPSSRAFRFRPPRRTQGAGRACVPGSCAALAAEPANARGRPPPVRPGEGGLRGPSQGAGVSPGQQAASRRSTRRRAPRWPPMAAVAAQVARVAR